MPSRPPVSPNALSEPAPVNQTLSHADAYAPLTAALPQRQQSFASQPAPVPSTIVAPAAPQSVQPLSQFVSAAVAPVPSTVAVFPRPPMAQLPPQALTAVQPAALLPAALSHLLAPPADQPAPFAADWEEKDAYTLLKLSSRARFVETSGNKIRGCIADLELF